MQSSIPNLLLSGDEIEQVKFKVREHPIGYCLGDAELIEWALRDPGHHGPTRGGFYPVMDTMIRDGHFWAEAPIYALHYDIHGMFSLAEAALRYDGTNLYEYTSPKSGASLKKIVDGYLRMAYPLERTNHMRIDPRSAASRLSRNPRTGSA